MNKKFIHKVITLIFGSLLLLNAFSVSTVYAAARDCDTNALIYCGTLSKTELKNKLNNGTGKQYQSSTELKALFGKWGFGMADIDKLQDGRVNTLNQVFIGNTIVAYNVYTYGRHDIAGSTKVADISYPIYKRHPQVSFLSSSIDAYVYTNYDGSMAYAILKSCGNIVQGVGKKTPPPPPPTTTAKKISINIQKFEDLNKNGVQDTDEKFLPDWQFRVSGSGVLKNAITDQNGQVTITDLAEGIYVVTEVGQTGWTSTTGLTMSHLVTADPNTQTFVFGNVKIISVTGGGGGGGEVLLLPSTGLVENIAITVAIVLAFALLAYFGTRAYLRRSLAGYVPPTDPRKLVKELRKRTKERAKKTE